MTHRDEVRELLAGHLSSRHFPAGTVLWQEGDTDGMLVLLQRGHVRIFRTVQGDREVPVFVFGPGDLFGFMPLLDGSPYPAGAVTRDDVSARVLSRDALNRLLAARPEITRVLLAALSRRLRGAFAQIELLSARGALTRVAAAILALAPPDAAEPVMVEFPVEGRDLAEGLGLTPPTLSRALAELEASGVIHKLGPRRYQVLDALALAEAAHQTIGSPLGPVL